ncbi:S-layer homology domain-containing protein [Paenibacillus sp. MMS20-IR301]|uniref:S-layer homology domain-containing protein n=1 Tax=Paenibacillus sp. MMS20-IR301 TaxID=2895946 RepID=UPI0028E7E6C2|nr:S-layer homology domain-containing protein [Paenibacillus sp. MMS20-IR301]WNS41107.1 S-layer homology domain-containing protein [Paenibacillus sp. MMS20-IR301]
MKKTTFQKRATKITLACSILAATVSFGASASAFSDLKGHAAETKINALHQNGIINGITSDKFAPKSKLTYAQGLQFIVSGLKLAPVKDGSKASDHFDKVKDSAWYASAFLTAKQSGLALDKTIDPNAAMTRIQFAHLLTQALQSKGNFPVTLMYAEITDGGKLTTAEMNSLQILFNTRLLTLEKNNTFRPYDPVTRAEAAVLIYDAAKFAKEVITPDNSTTAPAYEYESAVTLTKAGEGVNKATVTVDNLPNPGYGLAIERIEFGANKTAVIYFKVTPPSAGSMNLQVISSASADTYLPDGYTATAKSVNSPASSASSSAGK